MDDLRIKIICLKGPSIITLSLIVRNGAITDAVATFIEYVTAFFEKLYKVVIHVNKQSGVAKERMKDKCRKSVVF